MNKCFEQILPNMFMHIAHGRVEDSQTAGFQKWLINFKFIKLQD